MCRKRQRQNKMGKCNQLMRRRLRRRLSRLFSLILHVLRHLLLVLGSGSGTDSYSVFEYGMNPFFGLWGVCQGFRLMAIVSLCCRSFDYGCCCCCFWFCCWLVGGGDIFASERKNNGNSIDFSHCLRFSPEI